MGLWWDSKFPGDKDLTRKRGSRWIIMVQGEVQMFNAIYRKQVLRHWERFSKVTNSCFSSVMNILPVMLVPSAVFGNVATQILWHCERMVRLNWLSVPKKSTKSKCKIKTFWSQHDPIEYLKLCLLSHFCFLVVFYIFMLIFWQTFTYLDYRGLWA